MERTRLRQALVALQEALASPDDVGVEDRELMAAVRDDIEHLLDLSSEAPREAKQQAAVGLRAAVAQFEERHPTVTRVLGSLLDTMSGMGI